MTGDAGGALPRHRSGGDGGRDPGFILCRGEESLRTSWPCIANPREAVALVDLTLHCTALSATVSGFLVDWTGLDWTLQVAVAVVVAVAVAISRDSQVSSTDT